jgi:hypothetical protein
MAEPLRSGCFGGSPNWSTSFRMSLAFSDSSRSSLSMRFRSGYSGYGQGRTKNHPTIIGAAVPTPRASRKPEVFPGKNACAIAEKTKADNPMPEEISPSTVVLCTQRRDQHGLHRGYKNGTDNSVREALHSSVQRRIIPCLARDPNTQPKQEEYE